MNGSSHKNRTRYDLAGKLAASLENTVDADSTKKWQGVIERRSREIEEGKVNGPSVEEIVQGVRVKLKALRKRS